jgi:phosphoribosylformylglycinamidine cyclo-ligase
MGHRMELYCAPEMADKFIAISKKYGVDAQIVGRVEASEDNVNHVTIKTKDNTFNY